MVDDKRAQESVESGSGNDKVERKPETGKPAGGPHAKDHLTDHDKTPGTGSLPAKGSQDTDAGPE